MLTLSWMWREHAVRHLQANDLPLLHPDLASVPWAPETDQDNLRWVSDGDLVDYQTLQQI